MRQFCDGASVAVATDAAICDNYGNHSIVVASEVAIVTVEAFVADSAVVMFMNIPSEPEAIVS